MKAILFGATGLLGSELASALTAKGYRLLLPTKAEADFQQLASIERYVQRHAPALIVNAAAYTQVDQAELEPALVHALNVEAVACLARLARQSSALLVNFSSDYVFDGLGSQSYTEACEPRPLNRYGQSKLEGEQVIIESGCAALQLRTSWLYGVQGEGFPQKILQAARRLGQLRVVDNQVGTPNCVDFIAQMTVLALSALQSGRLSEAERRAKLGLYHVSCQGQTSWYDYANAFFAELERQQRQPVAGLSIEPVSSSEYQQQAQRPAMSHLDASKFCAEFAVPMPHWLDQFLPKISEFTLT